MQHRAEFADSISAVPRSGVREPEIPNHSSIAIRGGGENSARVLKETLDSIPMGVSVMDGDLNVVAFNQTFVDLLEFPPGLIGPHTSFEQVIRYNAERGEYGPGDVDEQVRERVDLARKFMPHCFERERPDGTVIEIRGNPMPGGGFVTTYTDITKRKTAEREVCHLNGQLLDHAERLERSNSELEQFAYVASHDLQEPLRMVASYCQLLQRRYADKLDEDANEFIAFAVDGATRMQELINDLLAYSRVATQPGQHEPVDLGEVLDAARANLTIAIEESGAKITAASLPTIPGNRTQLAQVFQNLLGNAIKFRGEAKPEIHVGAWRQDDVWQISLKDNSIGMDPNYADRIFQIFQRLHSVGKYPGTGIGLAVCKKIVERHGGRIWVDTRLGCGSTFHFTLSAEGPAQGGSRD